MLVGNWMSKEPVTVTPETSMMRASKVMKDKNVRGLSVVDKNGILLGIVTDRDIKEASPSKATTLDVHELYYLLSEIKVQDIMSTNLVTIQEGESVEKAAVLMLDTKVGGLPVVDDAGKLVGVITQSDVFEVLISITGVLHGGFQVAIDLPDDQGTLGGLVGLLNKHNARIMSILTAYEPEDAPTRRVFVRIQDMDKALQKTMMEELKSQYNVLFTLREEIQHSL
ncbi:CBS and ACT domain-containing protein [Desulfovibrio ferrophilus]|uniref:CBS domain containing membrane protein n=1 Tax=Desulfovibrio ferrophilus TaxID=241368 RepID=A0A2Z6AZV6_9BACT|nr:CBS and ACT domain-containing protein [Desulfovibrio ferrophilus]BBD08811.1 CBS domain containing membrane protein [Desulfovibrio ferrophilus]